MADDFDALFNAFRRGRFGSSSDLPDTMKSTLVGGDQVQPQGFTLDQYGQVGASGGGFGASWLSFIAAGGIYNADFLSGDLVDIAVTEVGTGSTIADYNASLTLHLPYWVVAASDGTLKVKADANASGGFALSSTASVANQTNRIYQDIPLPSISQFGLYPVPVTNWTCTTGTMWASIYCSYRDANHAILGTRTAWDAFSINATSPTGYYPNDSILGAIDPPVGATYLRVELEVIHQTSVAGQEFLIDYVQATPRFLNIGSIHLNTVGTNGGSLYAEGGMWVTQDSTIQGHLDVDDSLGIAGNLPIYGAPYVGINPPGTKNDGQLWWDSDDATVSGAAGSGTSFPGSPTTSQTFFRTDLGMDFYYDGTRWLSKTLFTLQTGLSPQSTNDALAATGTGLHSPLPLLAGGSDIYLVSMQTDYLVNGGTALSGSNSWVGTWVKRDSANASTAAVVTVTINSGASSAWRRDTTAINALMNNGTTYYVGAWTWTKTGTPGNLYRFSQLTYRLVAV